MASCHFVRVANKILNVNTLIDLYFIGSHDASASWWHVHVPLLDQKNAANLIFPATIKCASQVNMLYFQAIMHFSGSTMQSKNSARNNADMEVRYIEVRSKTYGQKNNPVYKKSILMYRYFLLCISISCLLLQGCSFISPSAAPSTHLNSSEAMQTAWIRHQKQINTITGWQLTGRIGVKTGKNAEAVNVNWQRQNQQYVLIFSGPFGKVLAKLSGSTDGSSVLLLPGKPAITGASTESLIKQAIGMDIPTNELTSWITGIPASGQPTKIRLNTSGRMDQLNQKNWHITYSNYILLNNYILPSYISAVKKNMEITIALRWQSLSTS